MVVGGIGGVVPVPVGELPVDDVAVDGTPDDKTPVGGEPPAVDIVVEVPPEMRAVGNQ